MLRRISYSKKRSLLDHSFEVLLNYIILENSERKQVNPKKRDKNGKTGSKEGKEEEEDSTGRKHLLNQLRISTLRCRSPASVVDIS